MRFRFLLAAAATLLLAPSADAQEGQLRVDLNIPELRLNVYEGDEVLRSYPVAVGLPGHDTPTGRFAITHAEWNPWWRPPAREWAKDEKITPPGPNNPMGRVKLFFLPYYFFHGTPESGSIGSAASHGCVRMLNKDAIALARLLHERAAPQVSSAQINRILASSSQTRRVNFRESIPVTIRYDLVTIRDGDVNVHPDIYGYKSLHAEAVYQALMNAGYDISRVSRQDVNRLIERGRDADETLSVKVEDAFGREVAATLGYSNATAAAR
jgi:murein L,D-transpeptidase YcbB/YkuD